MLYINLGLKAGCNATYALFLGRGTKVDVQNECTECVFTFLRKITNNGYRVIARSTADASAPRMWYTKKGMNADASAGKS